MNITDKAQWEESVTLLTRQQKVEGGQDGAANIQAKELANRTAWLKSQLESIPDYREYTFYITGDDPDGTIAGVKNTPVGRVFRVAVNDGQGKGEVFRYYLNDNGSARFINAMPSYRAVEGLDKKLSEQIQRLFLTHQIVATAVSDLQGADQEGADDLQQLFISQQLQAQTSAVLAGDLESTQQNLLVTLSLLAAQMASLDGFDPNEVVASDELAQAVENYLTSARLPSQFVLPSPSGLIRVDIAAPSVPASKEDPAVNGRVRITVDGSVVSCPCSISVQGASSAAYPKKNLNIKFYADNTYDEQVEVKLGKLLPHDRLVYKANWIDASHVRNVLGYQLWQRMVDARDTWPRNETDYAFQGKTGSAGMLSGANGHPQLYPCVTYVNGDFYGIGSLGTAKRYKNYALQKNAPLQIQMDHGDWHDVNKCADSVASGGIEFEAPSKPSDETLAAIASWDTFATAIMQGKSDGWEDRIDAANFIDFYLLCQFLITTDLISGNRIKNVQMVSYDGKKWFFMPYDLDTHMGLTWDGKAVTANTESTFPVGSFWTSMLTAIGPERLNARYATLRRKGVFSQAGLDDMVRTIHTTLTPELFAAEQQKWPGIPSLALTSAEQLLSWVNARLAWLDNRYSYTD